MPPKRAKKAAAKPPLEGCKIALSGTFTGMTQSAVKAKAEAVGATVSTTVTEDTTHLVATEADFNKPSAKVAKAQTLGIPIVNFEWLSLSEQNNSKQAEKDFIFGASSTNASNGPAAATTSRKRAAPAVDNASDTEVAAPAPKRSRGGRATAAKPAEVKDEDEDVKTEDAAPELKKAKQEKALGEGQVLKRKDTRIPIDDGCPFTNSVVYVDSDGVIYDASLNQTNASNNNNKTWTRWGRVGEHGQTSVPATGSLADAMRQFEKKFKDKSGITWANRGDNPKPGKYAFVERNYEDDSDDEDAADEDSDKAKTKAEDWEPPKCTLEPAVQHLLELIFNQQYFANTMSELNYDANKLPLGKLSKATITRGFQSLKDLSELLDDNTLAQTKYSMGYGRAVEQLSNTFYSLIPHDFGRNRPPVIHTQQMVKKEIELLESLSDMKNAAEIMKLDKTGNYDVHPLDKQYEGLKMKEMTVLDPATQEFAELKNYLVNTRGYSHGHNYQVESIFRIERQGEKDRFDTSTFGKLNQNRRLLWHGSRATNFGGILSQGLRIAPPEAPVNGYMFDKGIYLADMASKSANYCCSYQSGGTALLLLCEAELGDPMQELLHSSYNAASEAKQKGMISTWGKGRNGPLAWKDAGCVEPSLKGVMMPDTSKKMPGDTGVDGASLLYNEYIAYDVSQVRLRYLFRVKM
ncbi:poly polymerase catalytic domain-containing protein [Apiosordaria backusii]|uniref:Poly [ADP-ribose] polymerase n=1 Tax=Apiosordaria backusii TaxID=314023 RepID=A0AA39ZRY9_9PEZI|nr:poly polymerase catalytic domain-containing protein [Apiosordaria backusii]